MSQENINEAWADTEAGVATNIDINTKCDFEIDTKTAPKWSRDKKIQAEGAKEPPGDKGKGKDGFWDSQEKDDEFRKQTESTKVFLNFGRTMSLLILGTQNDTLLDKMNRFMRNLSDFRTAMIENGFPLQIVNLLYLPIVFVVLFLNCLRAQISWYIASFTILSIVMLIIGLILSLVFVMCKGASIYASRNEMEDSEEEEETQPAEQATFEGGSRDILENLLTDEQQK